jgi:hypothetical protein
VLANHVMIDNSVMLHNQVTMTFDGLLEPSSFCQFLRHRASGLELHLDIYHVDCDCAEIRVIGQSQLIDAFELASSLGPTDCQIDRITRRDG